MISGVKVKLTCVCRFGYVEFRCYIYNVIKNNKNMTNLKFKFMEGLIFTKDDETLEMTIHSLMEELDKEGFSNNEINEFILLKVKQYLDM